MTADPRDELAAALREALTRIYIERDFCMGNDRRAAKLAAEDAPELAAIARSARPEGKPSEDDELDDLLGGYFAARDAIVRDILAHRAWPPEYPGLALIPVELLDKLAANYPLPADTRACECGHRLVRHTEYGCIDCGTSEASTPQHNFTRVPR